jgi:multiple sugar transport system permease protein
MASVASSPNFSAGQKSGAGYAASRILPVVGMLFLIIIALTQILPFVFTVANSFKCLPTINAEPQAIIPVPPIGVPCADAEGRPRSPSEMSADLTFNPSYEGYQEVFNANLPRWIFNTAFFSIVIMLLRLAFDSMAGYALARLKFPGNRAIFFLVLGTLMVPGVVLLIPRFIILKQLGMLNTYQGVILTLAADGFGIFLMKQFFESIPGEIEEAAMVDGADRFTMFLRIILPMATPALTALAIFSFQGQWNNFLDVLVIIGGESSLWNLPLGLAFLRGIGGETLRWHQFLAGSVITTLPLAIIFFIFQRYFVEGVSYTGLKG